MSPKRFNSTQKRVLNTLISGTCFVFREKTLALAKLVLPFLPFGKAIAVASILVEKFPTTHATKPFYATARPRWRRTFVFRLNPYCPLSKLFALTGLFQPEITEKLIKGKRRGVLVDIGANFGYFSVLWLSKRNTEVLAVEPIRENYELLIANLGQFGRRAKTVMCCLGEQTGEVTMSYDPEYPMLSKINPHAAHGQRVEMRMLRDVLEETGTAIIEVLKCDAEGHDIRILSGAHEIFEEKRIRMVFFEWRTWDGERASGLEEFCQLLATNGYRLVCNKSESDWCYELLNAQPEQIQTP